jgi:hypothetical protein
VVAYIIPRSKLFGIILVNALVDEANQNRTANNIAGLHVDPLLTAAAQEKANDMVANNYFAHTSPAGVTPWYWFEKVGYNFTFAGENLAVNFSDSQDVTNAWMNSPEHRANVLNGDFTQIGMATAEGTFQGHPATYVVELFGTPSAPVAVATNPLVNTASAAATPATATSVTVTSTKPAPAPKPAPVPAPVVKPAPQPVVTLQPTSTDNFVAVKGASTQVGSYSAATETAPLAAATAQPIVKQSNVVQRAFSDPRKLANDFYIFLMVLFGVALIINVFVKIRIQHPSLIFSGLLVIVIAGIFIVLNQNVALLHAAIL